MKEALLEVIRFHAFGFKNKKPKDFLLSKLAERGIVLTERQFRQMFSDLAGEFLLGSCNEGYFVITSQQDFNVAIKELEEKADAISIRKNMLKANYQKRYGWNPQMELFDEQA